MYTFPSRIRTFLLRQSRRSLLVIAVTVFVVIMLGWQLAYGLYRATTASHDTQVGAPTSGQEADDTATTTNGTTPQNDPKKEDSKKADGSAGSAAPGTTGTGSNASGSTSSGGGHSGGSSGGGSSSGGVSSGVPKNALGVPISGTVLTLTGLNYNITNYMPNSFGGIFNRPPYTLMKVTYPASLAADSITKGVSQLDATVRSTPGQKIVLAHSQGAQVASRWMRQYANDPSAPSAGELTFILLGNPLRSTGGYIIGRPEVGGGLGLPTPTTTRWPIIDVARRYDGWADWVQNAGNQWAVDNATEGRTTKHTHYDEVNLYATTHTIWKSGNTTYVLTKEDDLPLWKNNADYPLGVRTAMRAYIESAYTRPGNDPRVVLIPIETQDWKNQLIEWGVPF